MNLKKSIVCCAVALVMGVSFVAAQSLAPVIMPEADLMMQIKLREIQQSPMYLAIKELTEEKKEEMSAQGNLSQIEKMDEFSEGLLTVTGLEPDDIISLALSADLDDVGLEDKPELDDMKLVAGVKLAKKLPIDRLESGMKAHNAAQVKEGKPASVLSRSEYKGVPVLQLKEADKTSALHIAMVSGDKLLLMGSQKELEGAIDREKTGKTVSPAKLFPASVAKSVSSGNFFLLMNPTSEMIAKMSTPKEGAQPNPAAMLMKKLKTAGVRIHFAETMDLSLASQFADGASAQQASMLIDAQAISGIKMMATMMMGGMPLPVLQTMKTGAEDSGMTWFKMSLSKADLDMLVKVAEQKMQQQGSQSMPPQGGQRMQRQGPNQ